MEEISTDHFDFDFELERSGRVGRKELRETEAEAEGSRPETTFEAIGGFTFISISKVGES